MKSPRVLLFAALTLLPGLPAHAGGNKGAGGVSFHIEGDSSDNPKMVFKQFTQGRDLVYRRVPDFTIKDVAAFNAFQSQDGEGYGAVLQLKPTSKARLSSVTNINRQRWMLAMVNGRAVDAVLIDKQVDDGYLVIWKGIGPAEIEAFDKMVPRLGEKKPRR